MRCKPFPVHSFSLVILGRLTGTVHEYDKAACGAKKMCSRLRVVGVMRSGRNPGIDARILFALCKIMIFRTVQVADLF
jgi:hypothetical protein